MSHARRSQRSASKRTVTAAIVRQYGRPRGVAGTLAGWVMTHRTSNRHRNRWVVSLLDIQPDDQVLEVGFGPGIAIAERSRRIARTGHVYGIDHSDVMLQRASKRNAAAIRAGTVTLTIASVEQLPVELHGPFDAILAVNSLGFWTAPTERLKDCDRAERPHRHRLATPGRAREDEHNA